MIERPQNETCKTYTPWLLICCGVTFGTYFASNIRLPVVPLYARSLDIDTASIGIMNAGFFLAAGLLSLPLDAVSDRIGRKRLATAGLVLFVVAAVLLCRGKTFYQLAGIYIVFGLAMAAFGPTMMSFVADISPTTHLGRSLGWYMMSVFTGMSLGPALGGFIAQSWGFQHVFVWVAVLMACTLVLFLLTFPATPRSMPQASQKESRSVELRKLFRNRPLLACWISTLGGCFGLGMFITFLPSHAQNQGLTEAQIGIIFFVQGMANALSRIPCGHMSDKAGRRANLVIIGLVGYGASLFGFGISATMVDFALYAVLLGLSMALAFTSVGAIIAEVVPPQMRGLSMGGYNTCIYIGMMLSSALMSHVIEAIGFRNGFFVPAALAIVLITLFILGLKGYRGPLTAE